MAAPILLAVLGALVISQVLGGQALERLAVFS